MIIDAKVLLKLVVIKQFLLTELKRERTKVLDEFIKEHENLSIQGTEEWKAERRFAIGGSEIGKIKQNKSLKDLIKGKIGLTEFLGNIHTRMGNLNEDYIRFYMESLLNTLIYETGSIPGVRGKDGQPIQRYSPDGLGVVDLREIYKKIPKSRNEVRFMEIFNKRRELTQKIVNKLNEFLIKEDEEEQIPLSFEDDISEAKLRRREQRKLKKEKKELSRIKQFLAKTSPTSDSGHGGYGGHCGHDEPNEHDELDDIMDELSSELRGLCIKVKNNSINQPCQSFQTSSMNNRNGGNGGNSGVFEIRKDLSFVNYFTLSISDSVKFDVNKVNSLVQDIMDSLNEIWNAIILFEFKCPTSRVPQEKWEGYTTGYKCQVKAGMCTIPFTEFTLYVDAVFRFCSQAQLNNPIEYNALIKNQLESNGDPCLGYVMTGFYNPTENENQGRDINIINQIKKEIEIIITSPSISIMEMWEKISNICKQYNLNNSEKEFVISIISHVYQKEHNPTGLIDYGNTNQTEINDLLYKMFRCKEVKAFYSNKVHLYSDLESPEHNLNEFIEQFSLFCRSNLHQPMGIMCNKLVDVKYIFEYRKSGRFVEKLIPKIEEVIDFIKYMMTIPIENDQRKNEFEHIWRNYKWQNYIQDLKEGNAKNYRDTCRLIEENKKLEFEKQIKYHEQLETQEQLESTEGTRTVEFDKDGNAVINIGMDLDDFDL